MEKLNVIWLAIEAGAASLWGAIKRSPWQVWVLLLSFATTIVYLFRQLALSHNLTQLHVERERLIAQKPDTTAMREQELVDVGVITAKYEAKHAEIDKKETVLAEAAAQGPTAIATEWANYLAKKDPR